CLWSKEPDHVIPTIADRIFGTSAVPGYLRKLLQLIWHRKQVQLFIGTPLKIEDLRQLAASVSPENRSARIKKQVARGVMNLRRVATGPIQKWKRRIIELVLRDEKLARTMKLLAKKESTTLEDQQEKARRLLYELAAEYSVPQTGFMGWC